MTEAAGPGGPIGTVPAADPDRAIAEQTGPAPRPRAGTVWRWCWGALAVIVLCFLYLHVSRTQRLESDGASNALQAWDILHGNVLLHGWTLTDVSFYTTELPEYVVIEAVRGLNADVLHVAAALSYALLVVLAALLARGRATGREAVVRMLIAAGIMVAPEPGPGVFIVLFQPDHIGTQVPMLVTWLVLDRAPRRWYAPVAVGVLLTWIAVADPIVLLVGVAPLVLVCGTRAFRLKSRGLSTWYELSLAGAALISVPAATGVIRLLKVLGGYTVLPVGTGLAVPSSLGPHLRLAADGVLGLYGAYLVPGRTWLSGAFALFHLAGIALAAWALCLVIRRFLGERDLIAQVLAAGIVINVAAYLASGKPGAYWSVREIAGILPYGAVLAGRVLAGRLVPPVPPGRRSSVQARVALSALAVFLTGYLAALGYAATRPPVPAISQDLADWLRANHVRLGLTSFGLGTYGESNATTQAGGGVVGVRPVTVQGARFFPGPREFDVAWYDPRAQDVNFVVLRTVPGQIFPFTGAQARAAFGRPARVYQMSGYTIMVWDKNLLPELGQPMAS